MTLQGNRLSYFTIKDVKCILLNGKSKALIKAGKFEIYLEW